LGKEPLEFEKVLVIPKVSAEQLRAKTGKTMRGGAAAGHRKFLHVRGDKVCRGKIIPAQVLPVLQGKGPCAKISMIKTNN
jgi:hypothetical protein